MTNTAPLGGDVPEWTLGNRLWRARSHLGVTQQELATRLGIGLQQVKNGESDKRAPRRGVILGWAVATGVDPNWLENGTPGGGDTGRDDGPVTIRSPFTRPLLLVA